MKRKLALGVIALTSIAIALAFWWKWRSPPHRPNVVFILVDTLRADYLGCYGFEGDISPHIDDFASKSVQFKRCSSQSPWTAPSVGSYFTSRYPFPIPMEGGAFRISVLPEKHQTLAESFQGSGYETRAFVENPLMIPQNGFSQGFDIYSQKTPSSGPYKAFDKFLQWYQNRKDDKPYFAYVHVMDVHGPYRYLEENYDAIKDSKSLGPEHRLTAQENEDRPKPIATFIPWADEELGQQRRAWRGAYAAGVRLFDIEFGKFLKKLEELGIADDCILVFTSDHGEQLLDNGGWAHGHNLHNYQTNVPLLVHYPKHERGGTKIEDLVSLIDITPTLAETCSLSATNGAWEGRSLVPLIEGESLAQQPAYATSIIGDPNIFSIRSHDRLLLWDGRDNRYGLYDVSKPSWLREDLAQQEPEVLDRLKSDLKAHVDRLKGQEPAMGSMPMPEHMHENVRALGYIK